jgi:hypothetical protein
MLSLKIAWAVPVEISAAPSFIHHGLLCYLELLVPLGNYSAIQIVSLSKSFIYFLERSSIIS